MNSPSITVVIPSYNHVKFISKAINSVLSQTFQDFELIIIDDCSQDNSVDIIKNFSDSRIKFLINETNKGAVYTLNKLIELARGEYIALLNSDDYWEPTKLEKQFEFLESHTEYGAVFTYANIIKEDGTPFEDKDHFYSNIFEQPNRTRCEWLNYFFNVGNCLCHPSILIRKDVYDDVGLYNSLMAIAPDFEMWVRVCLKYDIYVIPEKFVNFRILDNELNASGNNPSNVIRSQFEYKHILDHFLKISPLDYEKIFNEKLTGNTAYSLALKALEKPENFMKDWGLDILYKEITSNPSLMASNEFTKLTGITDVYKTFKEQEYFIQLFLDHGNGFNEESSLKLPITQSTEQQEFIFYLSDKHLHAFRLDPLNDSCVIEIESLRLIKNDGDEIDLRPYIHSNAYTHHDKIFFFQFHDPNIYFNNLDIEKLVDLKVVVEIRFAHIGKDAVDVCINQIITDKNYIIATKEQNIQSLNDELEHKEQNIQSLNDELVSVYMSKSWKITRPLRNIGRKLRNLKKAN